MISFSEMMSFSGVKGQAVPTSSRVKLEPYVQNVESLATPPDIKAELTPVPSNLATTKFVPPRVARKTPKGPSIFTSDNFDTSNILQDLRYFKNKQKKREVVVEKVIRSKSELVGNPVKGFKDTCSSSQLEHEKVSENHQNRQEVSSTTQQESLLVEVSSGNIGVEFTAAIDEGAPKETNKQREDQETNLVKSQHTNQIREGSFRCDLCNRYFTSLKYLGKHLTKAHFEEQSLECASCNTKFKSAKTLKQHVTKVHNRPLFRCAFCEKTFKTEALMLKHKNFVHERKVCQYCMRSFQNANTLRSHKLRCRVNPSNPKHSDQQSESPPPSLLCSICKKKFNHKSSLSRHKRQNHKTDLNSNKDIGDYVILDAVSLNVINDISVCESFVVGGVGTECVDKLGPCDGGKRGITDTQSPPLAGGGETVTLIPANGREGTVIDTPILAGGGEEKVTGGQEGGVTGTLLPSGGVDGKITGNLLPAGGQKRGVTDTLIFSGGGEGRMTGNKAGGQERGVTDTLIHSGAGDGRVSGNILLAGGQERKVTDPLLLSGVGALRGANYVSLIGGNKDSSDSP